MAVLVSAIDFGDGGELRLLPCPAGFGLTDRALVLQALAQIVGTEARPCASGPRQRSSVEALSA